MSNGNCVGRVYVELYYDDRGTNMNMRGSQMQGINQSGYQSGMNQSGYQSAMNMQNQNMGYGQQQNDP